MEGPRERARLVLGGGLHRFTLDAADAIAGAHTSLSSTPRTFYSALQKTDPIADGRTGVVARLRPRQQTIYIVRGTGCFGSKPGDKVVTAPVTGYKSNPNGLQVNNNE